MYAKLPFNLEDKKPFNLIFKFYRNTDVKLLFRRHSVYW